MSAADDRTEPIDTTTAALIRRKAGQLVRRARLSPSDSDDVAQELALDLLTRLPAYDPARGGRDVFVRVLLAHAAANLLRKLRAGPTRPAILSDIILFEPAAAELAREVNEVLAALPQNLRVMAEMLRDHSPTKVARELGLSRSTVYRRRRELRARFEQAGFRESV